MTVETFNIGTHKDICEILVTSCLAEPRRQAVFRFCFAEYAPIVLMTESITGQDGQSYYISQAGEQLDILRLLEVLGRNETGWLFGDGLVRSPKPSRLRWEVIKEAIETSRKSLVGAEVNV